MLLKLHKYYILDSNIKALEIFSGGEVDFDVNTTGELSVNTDDKNDFQIVMNIAFGKKKGSRKRAVPYSGKVKLVGYFSVSDSVHEEKKEQLLMTNGMSLLYGSAREHILTVTSRGPWPPFYLPVTSFRPDESTVDKDLEGEQQNL